LELLIDSSLDFTISNTNDNFLRLSQISNGIGDAIFHRFGDRQFWIVAEISDLSIRKGHCYVSLVEKLPGASAPLCELKGIIWSSRYQLISSEFQKATGSQLSANSIILFRASVRFDVKWGLSLTISEIEPRYTIGLIQIERDKTIARLKAEGVFTNNKEVDFPIVPQRIAVISAKDSRGFEDFMEKLDSNPFGYRFDATLFSSLLQGDQAPVQMVERLIEIFHRKDEFDLVTIVRGGGGAVDLNCFNDYRLARAIARFPLPVITGVGHTTNLSVSDEVAYSDRITPTDAADFLIEKVREFEEQLLIIGSQTRDAVTELLIHSTGELEKVAGRVRVFATDRLNNQNVVLLQLSSRLRSAYATSANTKMIKLLSRGINLGHSVKNLLSTQHNMQAALFDSLRALPVRMIEVQSARIDGHEQSVKYLDPVNVLKRGFSITTFNGKVLKNVSGVAPGDSVKTILYDGVLQSKVE